MNRFVKPLIAMVVWATCSPSFAQTTDTLESYIRLHYDKQEHMIPMRDGVKLFTAVYLPQGYDPDVPDPDEADAVLGRSLRRRQVSRRRSGRASTSSRRATSSSIRTSAGGSCRKGSSSR